MPEVVSLHANLSLLPPGCLASAGSVFGLTYLVQHTGHLVEYLPLFFDSCVSSRHMRSEVIKELALRNVLCDLGPNFGSSNSFWSTTSCKCLSASMMAALSMSLLVILPSPVRTGRTKAFSRCHDLGKW
jgi:hypothetical protein